MVVSLKCFTQVLLDVLFRIPVPDRYGGFDLYYLNGTFVIFLSAQGGVLLSVIGWFKSLQ